MKKVQVFGFVHSMTGPSMHAREFTKAISKVADVSLKTNFPINPQWVTEPELQRLIEKPVYDDSPRIILEDPMSWPLHMARKPKALIGVMIHEGTSVPYQYADIGSAKELDQIWTCSEHSKESILEGARQFNKDIPSDKVKVVPHGYNPVHYHPQGNKKTFNMADDHFTFLYVGGWSQGTRDRKGLDIFYQAFVQEFKKDEKVRMIAKITNIYNSQGYNPVAILQGIERGDNAAPIIIIGDDYANLDDLAALYRCADVFVMPTKADGFNIPGLEALACGVPVLAGDYGGQNEYLREENSWLLTEGTFDWATDANKALYDWTKWKTPSVKEMRQKLRYLYENQKEVKAKAAVAYDSVKHMTWDNSASIAMEHLKSLDSN